jgi:hypothetical protein
MPATSTRTGRTSCATSWSARAASTKWSSARARGFAEKYEELFRDVYGIDLVQIELDALPPEDLRRVFQERIDGYFDRDAFEEVVAHERREKRKVEMLSEGDGVRIEFARQVLGEMGVEADDDFRDAVAIVREEWEADDDAE